MATLPLRKPLATIALTGSQFTSRWEYPVVSSAAFPDPNEQEFTLSVPASKYRVVLSRDFALPTRTKTLPAWVEPTVSALVGIQSLSENWDSYGGKPISLDLINQSLFTLRQIMQADSPAPSVVPLGDGGIQVEWHRRQQDLEIVFAADEAPQFYYTNRLTGLEQQGFSNEIEKLTRLLIDLA
jgi:hypothetical protein